MGSHHYEAIIDPKSGKTYGDLIEEKRKEIEELEKSKQKLVEEGQSKNKEALELSKKLQKLKEVRDKTKLAIIETREKLYKLCTHDGKIRTEERNYRGGYLNRAEYHVDYYCELCGQKINEKVTYGGFA